MTVNNPPCSGPHSTGLPTDGNYVEVYVAQVQPTFFMRVLGINSETVTARAVATNVGASTASGCLYTLGSSPNGISGSGTLAASTCDIIDNGDFNTAGNTLTVSSDTTGIAGSSGGGTVTCTWGTSTCPTVGVPSSGNPLYLLAPPAVGAAIPFPVNPTINPPVPGSTYNGISIANETVVFPPGTYVVDGGNFSIGSGSIVQGTGVIFYFTNGATMTVATGAAPPDIQLSAPNIGQYAGILFYQDPNDINSPSLGGDSGSYFQGALYFPTAQLTFSATGTFNAGALYTIVIADSLVLTGSPDVVLNSNYSGLPNGVSIIENAVLAE